jgi:AcrR family transcriptional regulator
MAQRGPYSKTAQTRDLILEAALRIISENGYTGATLQQIADAVGMSKPGVLHHFGSRDALFVAVLEHRDAVNDESAPSRGDDLDTLIDVVRHNATVPGLVALYSAFAGIATTDPSAHSSRAFLAERYPDVVGRIADSIRARQARGEVAADLDAAALARVMVATSDGLQTQWLIDPSVDMAGDLEALWAAIARS